MVLNPIAEISRNHLFSSATIKPKILYNEKLHFTFKDNAPNLTSVEQIRNRSLFEAITDNRLIYLLAEMGS